MLKTVLAIFSLTLASLAWMPASAGMCSKSSESMSGMNKTCVYSCLTGSQTRNISSVALCPITIDDGGVGAPTRTPAIGGSGSSICQITRESTAGMNKICTYKCLTGEKSMTIGSTQLCPLTAR